MRLSSPKRRYYPNCGFSRAGTSVSVSTFSWCCVLKGEVLLGLEGFAWTPFSRREVNVLKEVESVLRVLEGER